VRVDSGGELLNGGLGSIARLLADALGTEVRAVEEKRLRSMIAARCRVLELADVEEYAHWLVDEPEELDALIDAAVVRETRFFRDATVFEHIQLAVPGLAADFPGMLRVLSAPCSTGQEAYSLAATLHAAGLPLERFVIDAVDIAPAALATARGGVFPESAVRGLREDLRESLGVLAESGFLVHERLRRRVRFERRNLALAGALRDPNHRDTAAMNVAPNSSAYHLILCRNLFIYLAQPARVALARSLADALVPGGRLVIGTADRVEELSALFVPVKPAASFAFVRREASAVSEKARAVKTVNAGRVRRSGVVLRPETLALKMEAETPVSAAALYLRAMEDERQGELRKAERRCRQALYLDPQYLPALELLQLLWRQQPSMRLRRALENRIERVRMGAGVIDVAREGTV
jgi:chemotaxis protein methyltransferase WspC